MAEKIICPKCNRESFTAAPHAHLPCPYCGQPTDKRQYPRTPREVSVSIVLKDQIIPARSVDISRGGMGIRLLGSLEIPKGTVVSIRASELGVNSKAEVVWQKIDKRDTGTKSRIGVKFIQ